MRKVIMIALVIIAVIVYSWDALLILHPQSEDLETAGKEVHSDLSLDKLLAVTQPVRFVEKGRSPFSPIRIVPNKASTGKGLSMKSLAKPKDTTKAIPVKVSGIMWNPTTPLAMITLPDGLSTVAKAGQVFGDVTVKKIEKTRVFVTYKNAGVWLP
jgi:hypothetical protein